MKYRKIIQIVIFTLTTLICQAQIHDKLNINVADFKSEKVREFDKTVWKSDFKTVEEGFPELPVYRVSYVLPIQAKISGVTFSNKEKQLLKKDIYIYPAQPPIPTNNTKSIDFKQPDEKTYNSDNPYPGKLYQIESDDMYQGYHIVTLLIYPFEYLPKSRTLNYYPNLEYTIEYDNVSNQTIVMSEKQSALRADLSKKAVRSIINNPQDIDAFGSNVISSTIVKKTAKAGLQKTQNLSIINEITPDYIIITCESLKTAFQSLADWETQKGIFAVIKTTEDIAVNYQGIDLQEKIRNYLIDAYAKYGANLYVLLGGDINIVPSRLVHGVYDASDYPTDKYYTTSSPWLYSNNRFYGNDGNSAINYVGRIPVSNSTEATTYINKLINYEKADNLGDLNYLKNNLYADAYLEYDTNGNLCNYHNKDIKSYVTNNIPSNLGITKTVICDNANCSTNARYTTTGSDCANGNTNGDIELNRANFLSCLNSGNNLTNEKFHFIFHLDHSGAGGMGTSSRDKGEGVNNMDFSNLSNGNSYQVLFSEGCHPANFQYDCIGKHYLVNPAGGGVAFIGNTDVGWQSEYPQLDGFLHSLYNSGNYSIGNITQYVLLNYSWYSSSWKLNLLGDPEMQVWTAVPTTLPTPTFSSTSVNLGAQTVNVTVSGLPNGTTGRICFWKGTEVYVTQENVTNGTYPISFTANTPGEIKVTVTAHNFKPYENTITVNSTTTPNLSVSTVDFGDGIVQGLEKGNANGQNDVGETINLTLGVKNTGVNTANNVTATLSCASPYITITSNQGSFGNIASGATATSNAFTYQIRNIMPEVPANSKSPIKFSVNIKDGSNNTWVSEYTIDVNKDSLVQCNKTFIGNSTIAANTTYSFNVDIQNIGKVDAVGLSALLTSPSTSDIISSCSSSSVVYPSIGQYVVKTNSVPFSFTTGSACNSSSALNFNLEVTNAYGKIWNFSFNLNESKSVVTGLNFYCDASEINLFWTPTSGAIGYNIYRCELQNEDNTPVGNYEKLNTTPVGYSYYNDFNLKTLQKYSYIVYPVSQTGNEGNPTAIMAWTSIPKERHTTDFGSTRGGVTLADINNDGNKEIFVSTFYGTLNGSVKSFVLGLDHNGNELFNIDNNVTTQGAYATLHRDNYSTPAIGDITKTGCPYLVAANRNYAPFEVNIYSNTNKNNTNSPDKIIASAIPEGSYKGSVLANIDNSSDGSMEVITGTENSKITIHDNKGNLLSTLSYGPTFNLGAVTVADIDNDGKKEIIKAAGTKLYIWKSNSKPYYSSNPVFFTLTDGSTFTNSSNYVTSSPVVCNIYQNDNTKEIIVAAVTGVSPKVYAICTDTTNANYVGKNIPGWNQPTIISNGKLSVGDIDKDGNLEIVSVGKNYLTILNNLGSLKSTANQNPMYIPDLDNDSNPILADIDGDNDNEIIFATSGNSNSIYAYNPDLSKVLGFPFRLPISINTAPAVADIDADDKNELVIANDQSIYIAKTNGIAGNIEWGSERHDQYNTGEYHTVCDPTVIDANTTWGSNQSICADVVVKSGTLTINNNSSVALTSESMIIVMSGASLVIDAANVLNANIRALAGSSVTIRNNGKIVLRTNAEFYTEKGTNLEIPYGSIDR